MHLHYAGNICEKRGEGKQGGLQGRNPKEVKSFHWKEPRDFFWSWPWSWPWFGSPDFSELCWSWPGAIQQPLNPGSNSWSFPRAQHPIDRWGDWFSQAECSELKMWTRFFFFRPSWALSLVVFCLVSQFSRSCWGAISPKIRIPRSPRLGTTCPLRGTLCPGLGTSPMGFLPASFTLRAIGPRR